MADAEEVLTRRPVLPSDETVPACTVGRCSFMAVVYWTDSKGRVVRAACGQHDGRRA